MLQALSSCLFLCSGSNYPASRSLFAQLAVHFEECNTKLLEIIYLMPVCHRGGPILGPIVRSQIGGFTLVVPVLPSQQAQGKLAASL